MDIFLEIRDLVLDRLDALARRGALNSGYDRGAVTVERPKLASHGEIATNAAVATARLGGRQPRGLAQDLADELAVDQRIQSVEIAGPGFINICLAARVWTGTIRAAVRCGNDFGRSERGGGRRINLEFVSANPTGPLHVGHARGAVFGDSLGRLLEFTGFQVTREYYLNDGGAQVDTLARSAYLRYLEANGNEVTFRSGDYRGDYLKAVGENLKAEFGDRFVGRAEEEWLAEFRQYTVRAMVALIHEDLRMLGIRMDRFFSELSLYESGKIDSAISRTSQPRPDLRGDPAAAERRRG